MVETKVGAFKLDTDPKETRVVRDDDPDVARGADALKKLTNETLELLRRAHTDPKRAVIDEKLERHLKETGYLDGARH